MFVVYIVYTTLSIKTQESISTNQLNSKLLVTDHHYHCNINSTTILTNAQPQELPPPSILSHSRLTGTSSQAEAKAMLDKLVVVKLNGALASALGCRLMWMAATKIMTRELLLFHTH